MTRALRVGLVGCGWAGTRHAQAYARCEAEVAWAVDVGVSRARALARSYAGCRIDTDYREMLADDSVPVVDVCLPHNLHARVAIEAAQAGKHVLCEKPIATSLAEADAMIAAARRAGVILMIAENVRYMPIYQRARTLLQEGAIGRPALLQMTRQCYLVKSFVEERPWFLSREAAAGGIMMSGGVHDFETMRMLVGEIESIAALPARQRFAEMEGDDTSIAMVRFCDGTVGTLVESFVMKDLTTASGPEVHTLRIDGDAGSLTIADGQTIQLFSEHPAWHKEGPLVQYDIRVPPADTFVLEIEHFLGCIRSGEEPVTSGSSQRHALEAVLAAYRSMDLGGLPQHLGC